MILFRMACSSACLALLGALSIASIASVAVAQNGKNAATMQPPAQPWVIDCTSRNSPDGTLTCRMSQTIFARESGQRVMVATVAKPTKDGETTLTLLLPHGISLTTGVSIWVDDAQRETIAIETADQNGSYASMNLPPERLDAMRRGKTMNIAVKSANGAELALQFSLAGFSSAAGNL